MTITDGHELIASKYYAENGPPHDIWTRLRAESPVHRCESKDFEPFWAVTKHADICEISTQPDLFCSEPGIVVLPEVQEAELAASAFSTMRVIIQIDPPEHREVRKVASPVFTPRAIREMDEVIERSAREVVDAMVGDDGEGECDFANDVAAAHPLRILSTMLGVPREQEPDILRLTNQLFANEDPELQREGDDRGQAIMELAQELYQLFDGIIQDRRGCPRDDLASILANGMVGGEPMGPLETVGYFLIVFTAGHDTTKNALVGGMRALIENPEEMEKIRAHPENVDKAVEEIVRWTSPVNYMKRTATADTVIRGQEISEGDSVVMFYASANRDEEVFDDPFDFRVDRDHSRNLGFGIGEHFCLGANLARRSQRALLLELGRRLEWAELAGEPEQIQSSFVVGLKHLPMRYKVRPATV
ncbi:MAG: cytochrome P450 [Actinomycetia bacterium]|nr:cytochrome P450 [Actinomycetes bacterium]